ncbi:hypothetical protein [Kibdelosporangium aridum]|uniref:hypothetical protein n=1 Tax=Kibdelosporangium aridum TaxID=2030 RepID=UPI0005276AE7
MDQQVRAATTADAGWINQELDWINAQRQLAHSLPDDGTKFVLLADLAMREAMCWEEQFERAKSRLQWRAALSAREFSLRRANYWQARATSLGLEWGAAA